MNTLLDKETNPEKQKEIEREILSVVERRIEIICETENREEIINDSIAPSGVKWVIMDIFNYWYRPEEGKGFY